MCRLAIMDKKGFGSLEKEDKGVLGYLDYLERNNGGHGNGYLLIKDGKIVAFDKGIALENETIYKNCLDKDIKWDWFIYHTRITSQGETCDEQCHPFVNKNDTFALCMNGTEREYGNIGKLLDTSDTDAIHRIWDSLKIPVDELKNFSSRFIGFIDSKVFFTNPKGYGGLQKADLEGIIVGSSFPIDIKHQAIEGGYVWREGEEIKLKKEVANNYFNNDYSMPRCPLCGDFMIKKAINGTGKYQDVCYMCGHVRKNIIEFNCLDCDSELKGYDTKRAGYCHKCLPKKKKEAKVKREEFEAQWYGEHQEYLDDIR